MIKEKYEKVELEIVIFQTDDVITTSGFDPEPDPYEPPGVVG